MPTPAGSAPNSAGVLASLTTPTPQVSSTAEQEIQATCDVKRPVLFLADALRCADFSDVGTAAESGARSDEST